MTAKEILTGCRDSVLLLRQLDEQLERCLPTGAPSGVRVQRYDAIPSGTNDPMAAAVQLYEGLLEQQEAMRQNVARVSRSAWRIIGTVRDVRTLAILNGYYLLGQTDQEIARIQGLSREHVNRLRRSAVEGLE